MPTYLSFVNYTEQGIRNIKDAPNRLDTARQMIKEAGGELKGFYLTLGQYDIVTIIEAPNDNVVAQVLLKLGAAGNVRTCTVRAFGETEFRQILKAVA